MGRSKEIQINVVFGQVGITDFSDISFFLSDKITKIMLTVI